MTQINHSSRVSLLKITLFIICMIGADAKNRHLRGNTLNDPSPRIIGGTDVKESSRYPYFTTVAGYGSFCGGALVAPDIVLSAAHCKKSATFTGGVQIGQGNDSSENILIQEKIFYPLYPDHDNYYSYDIMILKLKEVSTKPFVKLRKDPFIDQKLTVIGMGAIATNSMNNALANNPLKEAQFGYMENNQCQDLHGYNVEISNDMLCAFEDNKDICFGDGGGPMFLKGDSYEEDELVGTISTGTGCRSQFPGIYSRTSYFYQWIADTICAISANPPEYLHCQGEQNTTIGTIIEAEASISDAPTMHPTKYEASSTSNAPSVHCADHYDTLLPSTKLDALQFVSWDRSLCPIGHCQGDCDYDEDCAGDMVCYKGASGPADIPGCMDNGDLFPVFADFCVNNSDIPTTPIPSTTASTVHGPNQYPTDAPSWLGGSVGGLTEGGSQLMSTQVPTHLSNTLSIPTTGTLEFVGWDPTEVLGLCQGDCDKDEDCASDLICLGRSRSTGVPGCVDSDAYIPSISNFCAYKEEPSQPSLSTTIPTAASSNAPSSMDELVFVGWDPTEPLARCQGDCDRDEDCAGNMVCYGRTSGSSNVPGCIRGNGYVPSISDFCV